MTRKEFLTALDQYLVTMSASEKADIISDYEEHFRVGLENGKTEAEIAASLGSPYDVANQFLEGQKPSLSTAAKPQPSSSQQRPQASTAQTTQGYATQGYASQQRPQASTAQTTQGYAAQGYASQQRPQASTAQTTQGYAAQGYASQPTGYQQRTAQTDSGYVDYDRQSAERQNSPRQTESKYNSTGIIILVVLCVVLIPTVGSTIVGLLVGLYGSVIGFAAAGGSMIAAGTALSATSIWICLGLVFIGISFLALTGLLIMASIEGTKLFVKLIKYCIKEGKKIVTEGSF